ncbi:MAG TPA: hypothetical protein RMG45_16505, partial [Polyangiaceae bacterium LLY-WYZ-15_(1-7)]|nr:hypothetical protein [Polyangiaceae bacterium LLY-WYZ-15_(1-7)]
PEPMCVPMGGRIGEGEPCERTDQCMVGLACFRKREGGVCGRICCPASGAACDPEEEERCGGPGVLIDGSETEFGECLPPRACDVLADDACEPGESCYIVSSRGDTDCREAGEADVGEDCEAPNDCAAGLTCSGFFEQACVRICALEVEGSCPADEGTCVAYAQSPEGTGLCTLDATMMR